MNNETIDELCRSARLESNPARLARLQVLLLAEIALRLPERSPWRYDPQLDGVAVDEPCHAYQARTA